MNEDVKLIVEECEGRPHGGGWKIVLADLMTVLMVFFLTIWIIQKGDPAAMEGINGYFKGNESSINKQNPMSSDSVLDPDKIEEQSKLEKQMSVLEEGIKESFPFPLVIVPEEGRLRVQLDAELIFSSGSAEVEPEMKRELRRMAGVALDSGSFSSVEIQGHTDNVPVRNSVYRDNWDLSSARANSVRHVFIEAGFEKKLFKISGWGYSQPIVSNDDYLERGKNRRVIVDFILKKS